MGRSNQALDQKRRKKWSWEHIGLACFLIFLAFESLIPFVWIHHHELFHRGDSSPFSIMASTSRLQSTSNNAIMTVESEQATFPARNHSYSRTRAKLEEETTTSSTTATTRTTTTTQSSSEIVVLAGLVRSLSEIQDSTWEILADLSSQYNVSIHIVAATLPHPEQGNPLIRPFERHCQEYAVKAQQAGEKEVSCAPLHIEHEQRVLEQTLPHSTSATLSSNRIQRLAQIRDAQRRRIQAIFFNDDNNNHIAVNRDESIVMIADLDLKAFPKALEIMQTAQKLRLRTRTKANTESDDDNSKESGETTVAEPPHVICGAGMTLGLGLESLSFYDTFATVFLPDTFSHPLGRRLIPHHYPGEDPQRVRSADQINGNFTQRHISKYIFSLANQSHQGLSPVRSCFGGMAMYRASIWLNPTCRYNLETYNATEQEQLMRYASRHEKLPCEHVVYHDCLHRRIFSGGSAGDKVSGYTNQSHNRSQQSPIAIDPQLLMLWKKG